MKLYQLATLAFAFPALSSVLALAQPNLSRLAIANVEGSAFLDGQRLDPSPPACRRRKPGLRGPKMVE